MNHKAIEVTDLTIAYKDKPVLCDVDMEVPAGTLMAIVGPNGAGKTTLIKSILGLVKPAAGQVLVRLAGEERLTAAVQAAELARGAARSEARAQALAFRQQRHDGPAPLRSGRSLPRHDRRQCRHHRCPRRRDGPA